MFFHGYVLYCIFDMLCFKSVYCIWIKLYMLWTRFASASKRFWVRPCDHCFGRMNLIEQDTNTPAEWASNWYVLSRTKRGKLLHFLIMINKLRLWIRSSKVSSSCTQCSDRKYSFSSSATSWFRTPNFLRSKATDKAAGEWYEIERKCQKKLDRKSCMGFRMVNIFLISGDL